MSLILPDAVTASGNSSDVARLYDGRMEEVAWDTTLKTAYTNPTEYNGVGKITLADNSASYYGNWVTYHFRHAIIPSAVEITTITRSIYSTPTAVTILARNAMVDAFLKETPERGSGFTALVVNYPVDLVSPTGTYASKIIPIVSDTAYKSITVIFTSVSDTSIPLIVNQISMFHVPNEYLLLASKLQSLQISIGEVENKVNLVNVTVGEVVSQVNLVDTTVKTTVAAMKTVDSTVKSVTTNMNSISEAVDRVDQNVSSNRGGIVGGTILAGSCLVTSLFLMYLVYNRTKTVCNLTKQ